MNRSLARPFLIAGALSFLGMPWVNGNVDHAHGAPWIAPAPQQDLASQWVQDVADELRNPEFRNIFMNIPGGSPQSTILELLNEAAIGLQNDQPGYARQLVRHAVNVLDRSANQGWYTESDVQPIQAMILKHAKKGFSEADKSWNTRHQTRQNNQDRSNRGDSQDGVRLFDPDQPNASRNRWEGYTGDHWQSSEGIQARNVREDHRQFDRQRDRSQNRSYRDQQQSRKFTRFEDRDRSRNFRDRDRSSRQSGMERGGTQRYYSDEFYYSDYPWEDRGRSMERDTRRSRDRSYSSNRERDRMPWLMEQDRRRHARERAEFYREGSDDRNNRAAFDGKRDRHRYYESTDRYSSRGYNR